MKQGQRGEAMGRVWHGEESAAAVVLVGGAARRTAIGLVPFASYFKNCQWIYRIRANPGMPRGGIVPPTPVLAPGSALGSRPRVALSSAQTLARYRSRRPPGHSRRVAPWPNEAESGPWSCEPRPGWSLRTLTGRRVVRPVRRLMRNTHIVSLLNLPM